MNKDKVLSDLSTLLDQAGGGESGNGRQQGSGARRRNQSKPKSNRNSRPAGERATETAAEWVCNKCKAPKWVTRSVCRSRGTERPCESGRQTPSPPKPAPVTKKNAAVTYAKAVKDTNSSKATEKK